MDENENFRLWRELAKTAKYICPPMVRQSELAFRMQCRRYGVGLCYTPMLVAEEIISLPFPRLNLFQVHKDDQPLVVQICGNDPSTMAQAVRILVKEYKEYIIGVDINFGCPQTCAQRGGYGAFLMDDPDLMCSLVRAIKKELPQKILMFCKIRIYKDDLERSLTLAQNLEQAGCQVLAVHGRYREQRQHTGAVNWVIIREIVKHLSIPVIGNGGIISKKDADEKIDFSGCVAMMSATTLLTNPRMFQSQLDTPVTTDMEGNSNKNENENFLMAFDYAREYLKLAEEFPPFSPKILPPNKVLSEKGGWSVREHLRAILKKELNENDHLDLYQTIVKPYMNSIHQFWGFLALVMYRKNNCFIIEEYKAVGRVPTLREIKRDRCSPFEMMNGEKEDSDDAFDLFKDDQDANSDETEYQNIFYEDEEDY